MLFSTSTEVTRDRLVRYAGASRDFNAIHYNDAVATSVGLPGVIAHGMLTMGIASSALTDWIRTRSSRSARMPGRSWVSRLRRAARSGAVTRAI